MMRALQLSSVLFFRFSFSSYLTILTTVVLSPTALARGLPLCSFQRRAIDRAPGCEPESPRSRAVGATSDGRLPAIVRAAGGARSAIPPGNHPMLGRGTPP